MAGRLALLFIIKEENYDKPYLINENIDIFRKGLIELLAEQKKSMWSWVLTYNYIIMINFAKRYSGKVFQQSRPNFLLKK